MFLAFFKMKKKTGFILHEHRDWYNIISIHLQENRFSVVQICHTCGLTECHYGQAFILTIILQGHSSCSVVNEHHERNLHTLNGIESNVLEMQSI